MARDSDAAISDMVASDHYVVKCHELLDGVCVPVDTTDSRTMAEKLFNRLSSYIELHSCDINE